MNIYQVQIKHQHEKKVVTKYFVNRIEIGHTLQTPGRKAQIHSFLQEPGEVRNIEELHDSRLKGLLSNVSPQQAFDISVECRLRDQLGNTYETGPRGSGTITHSVQQAAYVKMINAPSILDINGTTPDPTSESLTLSMIDCQTLGKISKFAQRTNLGSDLMDGDVDHCNDPDEEIYHEPTNEPVTGYDSRASHLPIPPGGSGGSFRGYASPNASQTSDHHQQKQHGHKPRKVDPNDTPVAQLRKALQSLHVNQRVMSAKVVFTCLDFNRQRFEPTVSFDGVTYNYADELGPMEYITVSKAYKYQDEEEQGQAARAKLLDGIKAEHQERGSPGSLAQF